MAKTVAMFDLNSNDIRYVDAVNIKDDVIKDTNGNWYASDDFVFMTPEEAQIFRRKLKENDIDMGDIEDIYRNENENGVLELDIVLDYTDDGIVTITLD